MMRIVGSSLIVLSGAVCFGLGHVARSLSSTGDSRSDSAKVVGALLILAGIIMFLIEFFNPRERPEEERPI